MHPEDWVLVAVMTRPGDFKTARDSGWYRVPEKKAPRGVFLSTLLSTSLPPLVNKGTPCITTLAVWVTNW